jgi:hypothetical protein
MAVGKQRLSPMYNYAVTGILRKYLILKIHISVCKTDRILIVLLLDIPVGMYMQKYIFTLINSTPVSVQRTIIKPMAEKYENLTPYILVRGKTPPFFKITCINCILIHKCAA